MSSRYYRSHTSRRTGKLEKMRDRKHTIPCSIYTPSTTQSHPTPPHPTTKTSNFNPNHNKPCRHKPCLWKKKLSHTLQSWNGAYESKKLHKMEETKEKEKMKLPTIRIVVISESCLLIQHKKKVMQADPLIYYSYYILFLLSKCQ